MKRFLSLQSFVFREALSHVQADMIRRFQQGNSNSDL